MGCFACFGGGKQQRKEEERLASLEARSKAAEAAQKRQEQFDQSAAGKAARAQVAAAAKQSANSNKGEPVLKAGGMNDSTFSLLNRNHLLTVLESTNLSFISLLVFVKPSKLLL
ncbi:unnamed protein product [Camellia sinensis]